MLSPLSESHVSSALKGLPGWVVQEGKLCKTFKFSSFKEAFGFLTRVAFEAEGANHHPELFNVYSTVIVKLNTHDAGDAITQKDVNLAGAIERVNWLPRGLPGAGAGVTGKPSAAVV